MTRELTFPEKDRPIDSEEEYYAGHRVPIRALNGR